MTTPDDVFLWANAELLFLLWLEEILARHQYLDYAVVGHIPTEPEEEAYNFTSTTHPTGLVVPRNPLAQNSIHFQLQGINANIHHNIYAPSTCRSSSSYPPSSNNCYDFNSSQENWRGALCSRHTLTMTDSNPIYAVYIPSRRISRLQFAVTIRATFFIIMGDGQYSPESGDDDE